MKLYIVNYFDTNKCGSSLPRIRAKSENRLEAHTDTAPAFLTAS